MRPQRPSVRVPSVASEFETVRLPDQRLRKRLRILADCLSAAPDKGSPQLAGSDGALEGMYRFFNNARISPKVLMEGHFEQTNQRLHGAGTVLVVHDTTEMEFQGESSREGLGLLRPKAQGFLLHTALCVGTDGTRRPLGVLGAKSLVRTQLRPKRNGRRLNGPQYARVTDKESQRWAELVTECEQRSGEQVSMIHVMDREADAYPLLTMMVEKGLRFVVRLARDRTLWTDPDAPASDVLGPTQLAVLRACSSTKLPPKPTSRDALLAVAALGGHIRNNGEPGWIVLGRGMEKLRTLQSGWLAALGAPPGIGQN